MFPKKNIDILKELIIHNFFFLRSSIIKHGSLH